MPASFRDPSGYVYKERGKIIRQISFDYKENYDLLISSGLYDLLVKKELMIPFEEINTVSNREGQCYKLILPKQIPFISYPYEWCFGQIKAAALLTLEIQKIAFECGMTLKDASAFNVQFIGAKPYFIDHLSFEKYENGSPWVAYRQFCEHFIAPLALVRYCEMSLSKLIRVHLNGIPLNLASRLLPRETYLNFRILIHIHLHSNYQSKYGDSEISTGQSKISISALKGLVASLEKTIRKMECCIPKTEWSDYYKDSNYTEAALTSKKTIIGDILDNLRPNTVWDLGGNVGVFSRIASKKGIYTLCFDLDCAAVELDYRSCISNNDENILPLAMDISNPSPSIGWANEERESLAKRGSADVIMVLALVHHLCISNNIPMSFVARYLSRLTDYLIIEFIPKEDSQVQRLLSTRKDIFNSYNLESFEKEFSVYFNKMSVYKIDESLRYIYVMRSKYKA